MSFLIKEIFNFLVLVVSFRIFCVHFCIKRGLSFCNPGKKHDSWNTWLLDDTRPLRWTRSGFCSITKSFQRKSKSIFDPSFFLGHPILYELTPVAKLFRSQFSFILLTFFGGIWLNINLLLLWKQGLGWPTNSQITLQFGKLQPFFYCKKPILLALPSDLTISVPGRTSSFW